MRVGRRHGHSVCSFAWGGACGKSFPASTKLRAVSVAGWVGRGCASGLLQPECDPPRATLRTQQKSRARLRAFFGPFWAEIASFFLEALPPDISGERLRGNSLQIGPRRTTLRRHHPQGSPWETLRGLGCVPFRKPSRRRPPPNNRKLHNLPRVEHESRLRVRWRAFPVTGKAGLRSVSAWTPHKDTSSRKQCPQSQHHLAQQVESAVWGESMRI